MLRAKQADWYDAGNKPVNEEIVYRWRDGRPMRMGPRGKGHGRIPRNAMGDIRRQRSHLALSFAHLIRTHDGSGASWTCLDHQYRYTATDLMLSVPQMFRLEPLNQLV